MSGLDVLRARVTFRERSLLDVLDLALRFSVVHARDFGKLALLVLVPSLGATIAVGRTQGWAAAWALSLALAFAADVPFTLLVSRLVFEDDVRVREVVRASLRTLPRVLALRLTWLAGLFIMAAFFFVPGLWFAAVSLFSTEVLLLENAGIGHAFVRSHRIASASLADALFAVIVFSTAALAGVLVADVGGRMAIADLLQFRPPAPLWANGGSVLAFVGWFAVLPYLTTARFFVYLNLRTRAEGWDIQTRFAAIAARAEAAKGNA
ncbi:hypothetical protein AKJ09_11370 [Labilithrix luteola]|uniref:Uncharacterized protein n=1 Tax=Labilithrix luteola TaxID=1391654 RepID=A0A0K1QGD6_9BACT|nr:hypothetical protein [Labilithrix luteola]AKV04707.1 hypothetical protein AKJ09_11370 [Labilithrix luteola]